MEGFIGLMNTTVYIYPENMKNQVISDHVAVIFKFVNFGVMSGIMVIALVGICANTANVATFVKLGFHETINISLTALAIADSAHLVSLLTIAVCYTRDYCGFYCDMVNFEGISYVIGAIPRYHFVCIAGFITSLVAFERCVCVFKPLHVRSIFSKRKSIAVLLGIFTVVTVTFAPIYYNSKLDWVLDPYKNRSLLSYFEANEGNSISLIMYRVMSFLFIINYATLTVCTATIGWKLSSHTSWWVGQAQYGTGHKPKVNGYHSGQQRRQQQGQQQQQLQMPLQQQQQQQQQQADNTKALLGKYRRATRTVVLVASMYIICSLPGVTFLLTKSAVPDLNRGMSHTNIYDVLWSCAYISEGFCSCANIVVYVKTSTRFKQAFWGLFTRKE